MMAPTPKICRYLARLGLFALAGLAVVGNVSCVDEVDRSVNFIEPHEYGHWEYPGKPDIDGPRRVVFGDLVEGETAHRRLTIANVGRDRLNLDKWKVTGAFGLDFPDRADGPPTTLLPGDRLEVSLSYTAHNLDRATGRLDILSNDPDEATFSVALFANADFPCLQLEPADEINFGAADLDQVSQRTIIAKNCADRTTTTVWVESVEGAAEFRLLDDDLTGHITIEPAGSVQIPIGFNPHTPGEYEGAVFVSSNDETQPDRIVDLVGRGKPYDCPEAVIRAYHPERGEAIADPRGELRTVPLDTIELDASLSRDPEGSGIARAQWRLVEQPTDSTVEIANPDALDASLWMQLAGNYTVELDVWNERGVESCEPARLNLRSIADQDIHIQLVWDTPDDTDQTDTEGADVDLHLLHARGHMNWELQPWDCYWQNMNPDWGVQGQPSDDPSLDIDDIDGAGPENINLDNPQDGKTYHIGVHYFHHHGFNRSYVTVRVFVGGALVHEAIRKPMDHLEFWHVADLSWPEGRIIPVDQLYETTP